MFPRMRQIQFTSSMLPLFGVILRLKGNTIQRFCENLTEEIFNILQVKQQTGIAKITPVNPVTVVVQVAAVRSANYLTRIPPTGDVPFTASYGLI